MIQIDPVRLERDENDLLALDPKLPLRLSENREIRDFAQRNLALHLGPHFLHLQSAAESRPQVDFRDSVDPRERWRRSLFRLHYVVQ
jgi:hypothetical protein